VSQRLLGRKMNPRYHIKHDRLFYRLKQENNSIPSTEQLM
jgi:hypothetical protein